jgi:hypothetical protein
MPKAKTASKSKPTRKTFHKHVAEEPVTPNQESTPQTTPPAEEKVIQPEPEPEPEPQSEPEIVSTDPQPQPVDEISTPTVSEITPPETVDSTPEIVETISPSTIDVNPPITENTTSDSSAPKLTPEPEEPQNPEPLTPAPIMSEDEGKSKKPIIVTAIIVVILISIVALYFFYTKQKTTSQKSQSTPITQTSESSPKPSPQALNRADWTLEILNGSSKKGAAAALADKLTAKGYQVIKTGNNPEDFATSQVYFSDSTKDQADLFLEDIKEELPNPTNAGTLTDSTASARIIIGAE